MARKIFIFVIDNDKKSVFYEFEMHYLKQMYHWDVIIESMSCKKDIQDVNTRCQIESEMLLKSCPAKSFRIALDENGIIYNTKNFQIMLNHLIDEQKSICFLIGGADGHTPNMSSSVDKTIALSAFTFSHKLARLILVEQIYRVYTMTFSHPYHRN